VLSESDMVRSETDSENGARFFDHRVVHSPLRRPTLRWPIALAWWALHPALHFLVKYIYPSPVGSLFRTQRLLVR
jgi:hypothetical protein